MNQLIEESKHHQILAELLLSSPDQILETDLMAKLRQRLENELLKGKRIDVNLNLSDNRIIEAVGTLRKWLSYGVIGIEAHGGIIKFFVRNKDFLKGELQ